MKYAAHAVFGSIGLATASAGAVPALSVGLQAQETRCEPPAGAEAPAESHATASLITSETGIVPGRTLTLGVHFVVRRQWHLYWEGQNETGTPIRVKLTLPDGIKASPIQWPAPVRHVSPGKILDHVYEGEVTLLIPLEASQDLKLGVTANIKAAVDWVVCKDVCLFENATLDLALPVASESSKLGPSNGVAAITTAKSSIPTTWNKNAPPASITWTTDRVDLQSPNAQRLEFYPMLECIDLVNAFEDAAVQSNHLSMRVKRTTTGAVPPSDRHLLGILALWRTLDGRADYYLVDESPAGSP